MSRTAAICLCLVFAVLVVAEMVHGQDGTFFLKASKSVPRIGKRSRNSHNNENNNSENFEKFFLKASKSVPRIGRRDYTPPNVQKDLAFKAPLWSDLVDLYAYNPELFSSPEMLAQLEDYKMMGTESSWDRMRVKRTNDRNGELLEYRLQAEN